MLKNLSKFMRNALVVMLAVSLVLVSGTILPGTKKVYAAAQATYYVSPTGSDSNPGTQSQPFATVTKARDVIRTINGNMTGDIIVYLRGGKYYLNSPITFTEADSGTNGYNIYYMNYSGETPEIIGGQKITGWVQDSGNIYKANVGTGWTFHTLFENGVRAVKARYPNTGYLLHDTGSGNWAEAPSAPSTPCWFTFRSGNIPNWSDMVGGEVNIWGWFDWHNSTILITAFDYSNRKITLQRYPIWGVQENPQTTSFPRQGNYSRYYIQGVKSALDVAGEFYLNTSTGYLYYYPRCAVPSDINSQEIIAPKMKNVIEFKGSATSNLIHNIQMKGVKIRVSDFSNTYDTWYDGTNPANRPLRGAGNSDAHYENNEPSANRYGLIYLNNAKDITLHTLDISNTGYNGVFMDKYCQKVAVFNSQIYDIGMSGVFICGGSDNMTDTLISRDNLIQNNYLYQCSKLVGHGNGVTIEQSAYNNVNHNEIHDIRRAGIMLLGSYDNSSDVNLNRYNLIDYNKIYNCVTDSTDNGNIYTFAGGKNNKFDHNMSYDVRTLLNGDGTGPYYGAYYLDNHSDYWTVSNNIGYTPATIFQNDNYPTITLTNNSLSSNPADWAAAGLDSTQMGHITMTDPVWPAVNVAPQATVTASSEFSSSYAAAKAVDGIIGVHDSGEWASNEYNPWIQLNWGSSQKINKVVLYDRPNTTNWIPDGTLTFSDSSSISVTGIPNNGTAKEVSFADKTVTWVKFQAANGDTTYATNGLSEIQVYTSSGATPTPMFSDDFNDNSLGAAWTTIGGTWSESGQTLSQSSIANGYPKKAIISNSGVNFGSNHTITARVKIDSWTDGDYARAGIGLFTGTSDGFGYYLLFHNNHSTVAFLDDAAAWGPSYTFNWSSGTWYWFKLKMENGTLYGKIWQDGATEPSNWPYSWTRSGRSGYPGLDGGAGNTSAGTSAASFDDVTVTTN